MTALTLAPCEHPRFDDFGTRQSADFRAAVDGVRHSIARDMARAVENWAAQIGMTPEAWLEVYEPVPAFGEPRGDGKLYVTVTARLRELPVSFTMDAATVTT